MADRGLSSKKAIKEENRDKKFFPFPLAQSEKCCIFANERIYEQGDK